MFNLLDSSGSIGVTERTAYILRVRQLAVAICKQYAEQEEGKRRAASARRSCRVQQQHEGHQGAKVLWIESC